MSGVVAALCGALLAGGLFAIVLGAMKLQRPTVERSSSDGGLTRAVGSLRSRPGASTRLLVALGAGVVAFLFTKWLLLLLVVPLAVFGVPWLLSAPPNRELELLVALERWVRTLASAMPTGKSIPDAIRATRRQVPAVLVEPVNLAVMRMDARWTAPDALHAMADELGSADADACLAALALAAKRGGVGASATMKSLAEAMQYRLRALREIEAERSKPRVVVRQVTMITLVAIGSALLFGGRFFEPYSSPLGQVILAVLLAAYIGSLVMLRRRTATPPRERILARASHG